MRHTYYRVRGYPPFFNQALSWEAPADFYKDLYALYWRSDDAATVAAHPDWVLRDASGHPLYIPCDCSNGTCTQYAGNIGNPDFRRHWIDEAEATMAQGYKGIFIDDVNLEMTVSDGNGDPVRPIDPRTGAPMTDGAWEGYVAKFVEEIRAAMPNAVITHNIPWFEPQDAAMQREVAAADVISDERGFNDGGITSGGGTFGYDTLLDHLDWIHHQGADIILEPYLSTAHQARYEVTNYMLLSNGSDSISADWRATPDDFANVWRTDLGPAIDSHYVWKGLERRDFKGGTVLVNPPGPSDQVVQLPDSKTFTKATTGKVVRRVKLKPSRGIVLRTGA
jgi:hypothetical protein